MRGDVQEICNGYVDGGGGDDGEDGGGRGVVVVVVVVVPNVVLKYDGGLAQMCVDMKLIKVV